MPPLPPPSICHDLVGFKSAYLHSPNKCFPPIHFRYGQANCSTRTAPLPSVAAPPFSSIQSRTRYSPNPRPAPTAAASHVRQGSAVLEPVPGSGSTADNERAAARVAADRKADVAIANALHARRAARLRVTAAIDQADKTYTRVLAAAAAVRVEVAAVKEAEVAAEREVEVAAAWEAEVTAAREAELTAAREAELTAAREAAVATTTPVDSLHGSGGAATPPAAPQSAQNGETASAPASVAVVQGAAAAGVQAAVVPSFLASLPVAPPLTGSGFGIGAAPIQ